MSRNHLNALIIRFLIFIAVFATLYITSAYLLTFIVTDINWAMLIHIANIFIMFSLSLFITKHLSRWVGEKQS
ncbi:hypothetical protein [Lacicoccus alkaliphilus]|uniref:Uncharacterized protein n=1 Tax=Lacicoccus alkaliphilus DSM 16010 TaxID=1123231 RepID=A0A1M7I547_9BACL|nr:hypothetical protein [Salinicoccus alkaliphilus]SHM35835.1 hypothetical protein SAMN02745189_02033 [Salinicoccus alkaliphilus DSM 16010]